MLGVFVHEVRFCDQGLAKGDLSCQLDKLPGCSWLLSLHGRSVLTERVNW